MEKKPKLLVALSVAALAAGLVFVLLGQATKESGEPNSESSTAPRAPIEKQTEPETFAPVAINSSALPVIAESSISTEASSLETAASAATCSVEVAVRVVDGPNAQPVEGANVLLKAVNEPSQDFTGETNEEGGLLLGSVPCGFYSVHSFVLGSCNLTEPIVVEVSPDLSHIELLVNQYQDLPIQVLDLDDKPIAGLSLRAVSFWGIRGIPAQVYTTDTEGRFTATNFIQGCSLSLSMVDDAIFVDPTEREDPELEKLMPGMNPKIGTDRRTVHPFSIDIEPIVIHAARIEPLTICFGLESIPENLTGAHFQVWILGRCGVFKDGTACIVLPMSAGREFEYRLECFQSLTSDAPGKIGQTGTIRLAENESNKNVILSLSGELSIKVRAKLTTGEPVKDLKLQLGFSSEKGIHTSMVSGPTDANGDLEISAPHGSKMLISDVFPASYILPEWLEIDLGESQETPIALELEEAPIIHGEVLLPNGDPPKQAFVWAVDAEGNRGVNLDSGSTTDNYGRYLFHGASAVKSADFVLMVTAEYEKYGAMMEQNRCSDRCDVNIRLKERTVRYFQGDRRKDIKIKFVASSFEFEIPNDRGLTYHIHVGYDPETNKTSVSYVDSENLRIEVH